MEFNIPWFYKNKEGNFVGFTKKPFQRFYEKVVKHFKVLHKYNVKGFIEEQFQSFYQRQILLNAWT